VVSTLTLSPDEAQPAAVVPGVPVAWADGDAAGALAAPPDAAVLGDAEPGPAVGVDFEPHAAASSAMHSSAVVPST
jgi:hypothetical protein